MEKELLSTNTKNLIIQRFNGDINKDDFLRSLKLLETCDLNTAAITIIIDIRNSYLNLKMLELNDLIKSIETEIARFQFITLILLTSSPKQAAYSYILKQRLERPSIQIKICSYYSTAKSILN